MWFLWLVLGFVVLLVINLVDFVEEHVVPSLEGRKDELKLKTTNIMGYLITVLIITAIAVVFTQPFIRMHEVRKDYRLEGIQITFPFLEKDSDD